MSRIFFAALIALTAVAASAEAPATAHDPRAAFDEVDTDRDGLLSVQEVIDAFEVRS